MALSSVFKHHFAGKHINTFSSMKDKIILLPISVTIAILVNKTTGLDGRENLGDPGADSGARESRNGRTKKWAKKSQGQRFVLQTEISGKYITLIHFCINSNFSIFSL